MHNGISVSRTTDALAGTMASFPEACAFARAAAKEAQVRSAIEDARRRQADEKLRETEELAAGERLGALLREILHYEARPTRSEYEIDGITFFVKVGRVIGENDELGVRPFGPNGCDSIIQNAEEFGQWLVRRDLMTVRERARAAFARHAYEEDQKKQEVYLQTCETLREAFHAVLGLAISIDEMTGIDYVPYVVLDGVTFSMGGQYELTARYGDFDNFAVVDGWIAVGKLIEKAEEEQEMDRR